MNKNDSQPRLQRYKQFIDAQFINSVLWNKDYSIERLNAILKNKLSAKYFKRIIFTGMGCSAIVSDVIKGFFADQYVPLYIDVINDYDIDILVDKEILKDEKTLIIISSYSGYSQEPINFYNNIKDITRNIIFITSGGELANIAKQDNIPVFYWKLRSPDREYPLFHVPQYFSILLDIFFQLKILNSNYQHDLNEAVEYLKNEFTLEKINQAKSYANRLRDREIVFIATPKWYVALLKLANMHFNEMAMVSSHRNHLHEFTHSEVAIFSDPKKNLAIVMFRDIMEDKYTHDKMDRFTRIITDQMTEQNKNIEMIEIVLDQKSFCIKFLSTLFFLNHVAYFLGIYNNTKSRELISSVAGNFWYNQKTIQSEVLSHEQVNVPFQQYQFPDYSS